MRIRLTRRQLSAALIVAAGGVAGYVWFRPDRTPIELALPPPGDADQPSLEIFQALSRIVLARETLDPAVTQRLYDVFMDEPWGPQHIGGAYAGLYAAIARETWTWTKGRMAPVARLDDGQRWFVSHLATTWYLGVYYHEQRAPLRIARGGALMHAALRGLAPAPYAEAAGFGRWSDRPPGEQEPDR